MAIKIGEKAPDFSLYSTEKKEVSLSDFKDKNVLLLFFPLAFTGVCTDELCSIRDELKTYDAFDAQVLAISIDSPFVLGKYKEENGYQFPLLSDFNKDVSRSYGALYDEFVLGMKGVSKRSAFVIDKKGTIQYAEVLDNAGDLPKFDAIKNTFNHLND